MLNAAFSYKEGMGTTIERTLFGSESVRREIAAEAGRFLGWDVFHVKQNGHRP